MKKKTKLAFAEKPRYYQSGGHSCVEGPFFLCTKYKTAVTLLRIRKDLCDNDTDTILWLKGRLIDGTRKRPASLVPASDIWKFLFKHSPDTAVTMLREALEESERYNRRVGLDFLNRALREASKLIEAEKHNFRG